jgi:hypothetical protein
MKFPRRIDVKEIINAEYLNSKATFGGGGLDKPLILY